MKVNKWIPMLNNDKCVNRMTKRRYWTKKNVVKLKFSNLNINKNGLV